MRIYILAHKKKERLEILKVFKNHQSAINLLNFHNANCSSDDFYYIILTDLIE